MTNQRSLLFLLLGAVVTVAAVFGALHFAGGLSGSDGDVPAVAMSKGDVEKIVRNYLLENPEVIFDAVDRLKAKEGEQRLSGLRDAAKTHAAQLFNEAEPIVVGNPKGDVTVVEFFDYRCQYCRKVRQSLTDLMKQDGGVKVIFKEYPILSKESELAAQAAIASLPQGQYWDFHVALMDAEDLSEESIFASPKSIGLDVDPAARRHEERQGRGPPRRNAKARPRHRRGRDADLLHRRRALCGRADAERNEGRGGRGTKGAGELNQSDPASGEDGSA